MDYKILHEGRTGRGYNTETGIILNDIFSVENQGNNRFKVMEECDGWHEKILTKKELILMVEELKHWIENQDKE